MRSLLLIVVCAILGLSVFAGDSKKNCREKARYYYLEGVINRAHGKLAESHELFRKASEIDPTYIEARESYSTGILMMPADTIADYFQALEHLRILADSYPEDKYESAYYAYIARQLGAFDESVRIYKRLDSISPEDTDVLLLLAEVYTAKNDLTNAYATYQKYEHSEGKSSPISLRKIACLLEMGDTIGAVAEADSLIAHNPNKAGYYLLKGDIMSYINQPDSAYKSYRVAESVDPGDGEVKMALANHYRSVGDSIAYDNKVYEALLCDNFDFNVKMDILAEYLQILVDNKSNTDRGDLLFSVLRDQYPHESELLDLASRYYAAVEKMEDAVEIISYAIDMSPENEVFWTRKMTYLMMSERYAEVIECYEQSTRYLEASDNLLFLLATAYILNENLEDGIRVYGNMIRRVDTELPVNELITDKRKLQLLSYEQLMSLNQLYTYIGDAYYQLDNRELTIIAYENALLFYPESAQTLNNYAYFLSEINQDLDKAEMLSALAVKLEPDNPSYLDTYAWVYFKKGDYQTALSHQMTAVEKEGDKPSPELLEHMGDMYYKLENVDEAIKCWEQALELDPENLILQRKVNDKVYYEK